MSSDGVEWKPIARLPQVQAMVVSEPADARRLRETEEAQRLLFELDRFRDLKPHELFGVPANATSRDFRAGFAARAKHVHPGRLPKDVTPALLKAQMAVYQYLTEVLQGVEKKINSEALRAVESRPTPSPGREETWALARLQLQPADQRLVGSLEINSSTAHVFSVHRLMNLQFSSVFFPCLPTLALGTKMMLTFRFAEAQRNIETLGAVALESGSLDNKQHLRGFGVRLDGLTPETKGFMMREVQRLTR